MKGGKAGVNAVDFELVDGGWDLGERLAAWEELPVALTMNMVRAFARRRLNCPPETIADPSSLSFTDQPTTVSRRYHTGGISNKLAGRLLLHQQGRRLQHQANRRGRDRTRAPHAASWGELTFSLAFDQLFA